jgi:integrase
MTPDGNEWSPSIHTTLLPAGGGRKGWRVRAIIRMPGQLPAERWHRLTAKEGWSKHTREGAREDFERLVLTQFQSVAPPDIHVLTAQFMASPLAGALSIASLHTLQWHLNHDILPIIGSMAPNAINEKHCQQVIDVARRAGKKPNTLRRIKFAMSKLFTHAEREGIVRVNPCKKMTPIAKQPGGGTRILTDDQYRAALGFATGQWRVVMELLHATWIRRGELCGLQWDDIDFAQGVMHIRRSVYQVGTQHGTKPPKTNSGTRGIVLPARLLDVLRTHRAAQAQWRRDIDPTWADSDPALYAEPQPCHVFQRVAGGYLLPTTVSHAIGDIFKRAGLPAGMGPHALRHTGASRAMAANFDPRAVADRLGHASVTTTLDLYVHPQRAVQQRLADLSDISDAAE